MVKNKKEFVCGWGASLVNVVITFPINKTMFRQQLEGISIRRAIRQLKHEGTRHLYRGLGPPLIQRTLSVSIMFGTYANYRNFLSKNFPTLPYHLTSSCAAFAAGTTELLLIPFERVQVLLQAKKFNGTYSNTFHVFRSLQEAHGIKEFYRGVSACLIRNGFSNVLFFALREPLRKGILDNLNVRPYFCNFICGALLGAFLSTLFYPVNVVKTRMQARVGGRHVGIHETFKEIYKERGYSWRRMFHGVHINYSRSLLSWGIINATYEALMKWLTTTEFVM